ncbi:MAG: luxR-type protein [Pseudomonadota bacterium]|nr:luxR-type protein [Pseudomonadota bacterium]
MAGHGGQNGPVSRRTVPLTPRQRDILRLLCEGKVNKEIARELDIGLGTVKQHMVALFKRLQVRNRSMAVSQGMALLGPDASAAPPDPPDLPSRIQEPDFTEDGILMRRSCIVLSLAPPTHASSEAMALLHRTLAGLACDAGALFIPREEGAGDLLFGIRRSSEHDLLAALQLAWTLQREVTTGRLSVCQGLRAGLNAGMAIVSRERRGGWSGEAVATPVIVATRRLLQGLGDGKLRLGAAAHDALRVFGLEDSLSIPDTLPMDSIAHLFRVDFGKARQMVGREAEWRRIDAALSTPDQGAVLRLEGETGMGKSHLCRIAMQRCLALGGCGRYLRALPVAAFSPLRDAATGEPITTDEAVQALIAPRTATPDLLVIDDFHLLTSEVRFWLAEEARRGAAQGRIILLAGRRTGAIEGATMTLPRLSSGESNVLLAGLESLEGSTLDAARIPGIVQKAAGVPLFALELARSATGEPTLPLLMTIASRLDGFNLDWKLLQTLADGPATMDIEALGKVLGEAGDQVVNSVAAAVRAGVLMEAGPGQGVGFRHPLLRQVIALLQI